MNVVESIIAGILISAFSLVIGMLLGSRRKVTVEEFERHRDSLSPHISCPGHEAQLDAIEKKVDNLDAKLDRILFKASE